MRRWLALVLGAWCLSAATACRAPRLTPGSSRVAPPPPARGADRSTARRLGRPFLDGGREVGGGPYDRRIDEETMRRVERDVEGRRGAYPRGPGGCSMSARARSLEAPTGRGDEYTGSGIDVGRAVGGVRRTRRR